MLVANLVPKGAPNGFGFWCLSCTNYAKLGRKKINTFGRKKENVHRCYISPKSNNTFSHSAHLSIHLNVPKSVPSVLWGGRVREKHSLRSVGREGRRKSVPSILWGGRAGEKIVPSVLWGGRAGEKHAVTRFGLGLI